MEFFGIDLIVFIQTIGYVGLFAIIFAESGLLVGFFFPGDSLLFTAGFLASQGAFNIVVLAVGCFVAAVIGDSVGYAFGRRVGYKIFAREDSRFFKKRYLQDAEKFYEIHGKKTIILARFVPIVRTFAPILAGVGKMHYPTFLAYNLIGGCIWAVGMTVGGFFLGRLIPNVDRYLLPIVLVIIVVSMLPAFAHYFKRKK